MCLRLVPESAGPESVSRGPASSPRLEDCAIIRRSFFRRRYACGHRGLKKFSFSIWGHEVRFNKGFLLLNDDCPACLLAKLMPRIIRCADCERPILPGDPIATPCRDPRDQGKDWLTVVNGQDRDLLVCCLCNIDNELGFSGHWNGAEILRVRWVTKSDH